MHDDYSNLTYAKFYSTCSSSSSSTYFFNLMLQSEKQLRVVNSIPAEQRILHVDATGGLVKIPKMMRPYNQILNYVLFLKDGRDLSVDGELIIN